MENRNFLGDVNSDVSPRFGQTVERREAVWEHGLTNNPDWDDMGKDFGTRDGVILIILIMHTTSSVEGCLASECELWSTPVMLKANYWDTKRSSAHGYQCKQREPFQYTEKVYHP